MESNGRAALGGWARRGVRNDHEWIIDEIDIIIDITLFYYCICIICIITMIIISITIITIMYACNVM